MPDGEPGQPRDAREPDDRVQGGGGAAAVERHDRQQVEEVQEEAGERDGLEQLRPREVREDEHAGGTGRAEHRACETDLRLDPRVARHVPHPDHGAEERHEQDGARRDALTAQRDRVPELVHEQQRDEERREVPAPEQGVGADRDDHRPGRRQVLGLEAEQQQDLGLRRELRDQQREAADRREHLAQRVAHARARVDRAARRRRGGRGGGTEEIVRGHVPTVALDLLSAGYEPCETHSSPSA